MFRSRKALSLVSFVMAAVMLGGCNTAPAAGDNIPVNSPSSQNTEVLEGLVTMWHMDEGTGNTIYDSASSHNDGVISGASWVTGKKGYALSFNGVDNWVTVAQTFIFHQSAEATISFWINPSDTTHRPVFWTRSDNEDSNRFHVFSGWDNQALFGFDYRSADSELHEFGEIDVPLNQWTHIAIIRFGNDYSIYRNGQLVSQVTDTSPALPTYEGSWFIGRRNFTETLYKGLIDEIAIYNRALSPAEILTIYQG
ncbi:LamG domain-containing protein [Dehalococcoides mccartyi]|uniref:LamG-like jellyroll fold domain-containing protein n=1 Tax=Dehalococcoides mccartyi (strain VS) TaxID=311424 RepID=D2BII4_DEHMV|nr:LamG domain-containing protein [Dehalococcoides mccartyi]ACZ62134.1 hypothetical protein DhcVS_1017 [Dehalococcoides mccartyi VS]